MSKYDKQINAICHKCAIQMYYFYKFKKDVLMGITVHKGKCDICGVKRAVTPVSDFMHAQGDNSKWD